MTEHSHIQALFSTSRARFLVTSLVVFIRGLSFFFPVFMLAWSGHIYMGLGVGNAFDNYVLRRPVESLWQGINNLLLL